MVKESTARGGLFGFLLSLFSGQESKPREISWLTEAKIREVSAMYCDQCGFELGYETSTCTNCGRQMPNPEQESGMVRNYDATPEPVSNPEPTYAQETSYTPAEENNNPEPVQEPREEQPCCEEPPPQEEPPQPEESNEACKCPAEAPKEEPLNYAQKKEKKAILWHEIEELRHRVQPSLDELARLSHCASADNYTASLDSIKNALDYAREVECALQAKTKEYDSIIINPCCEHGFHNADKYCGTCGEYLGGMGWRCGDCQTVNKGDNHFCRGCGSAPEAQKGCETQCPEEHKPHGESWG